MVMLEKGISTAMNAEIIGSEDRETSSSSPNAAKMAMPEKGISTAMNGEIMGSEERETSSSSSPNAAKMARLEKALSAAMNAKLIASERKETMVLAHGYGADQSIWEKITASLSEHFQVLVFDWCFSGSVEDLSLYDPVKYCSYDAFADDLIALLDEMKLVSAIFVGHSMAGMVGCIASIKRPELFKRLILIGASPRYLNSEGYVGGFEEEQIDDIITSIQSNYDAWTINFPTMVVGARDPASVEAFANCLKRMRPEVALPAAKVVFGCDQRGILENVTTPCTIVQTSNDAVVPNSVAIYMKEKIKGESSVEVIDTEGHFPQLTAHVELLQVFRAVLEI